MNTTTNTRVSEAMDRLREIAHRDEAKAVTVRADDLRAVIAALSPEPAAQGEIGYFSADPAEGWFNKHKTLADAVAGAESLLESAQDDASDYGWQDEPPQICYGVVLGGCVEKEGSRRPAPEGSEFTALVDYRLTAPPAQPADSKVIGDDSQIKPGERVPEVDIKAAVSRFLGWLLPDDFAPDGGISYTPVPRHPDWTHDTRPTGTNLLHAGQAEAMLRYVLATPAAPAEEGDGKEVVR